VNWALLPLSCSADQPVSHGAKPEVHNQAPIRLKRPVSGQVQGWREQEVRHVAQHDREESLEEINHHS